MKEQGHFFTMARTVCCLGRRWQHLLGRAVTPACSSAHSRLATCYPYAFLAWIFAVMSGTRGDLAQDGWFCLVPPCRYFTQAYSRPNASCSPTAPSIWLRSQWIFSLLYKVLVISSECRFVMRTNGTLCFRSLNCISV